RRQAPTLPYQIVSASRVSDIASQALARVDGDAALRSMSLPLRQPKIAIAWSLVALAGAVAGWSGFGGRRDQLRADLLDETKRSAVSFEASELRLLSGTPVDQTTPAHATAR